MYWKEFISQIISNTVWPVIVLIIVLIFKKELVTIVHRITHLKYKELDIEFDNVNKQAQELHKLSIREIPQKGNIVYNPLKDQVYNAIERTPSAAILLAWSGLETAIASTVARLSISPESPSYRSPTHNIEMLSLYTDIAPQYTNLISELKALRNKIAHETMLSISSDQALNYANATFDSVFGKYTS